MLITPSFLFLLIPSYSFLFIEELFRSLFAAQGKESKTHHLVTLSFGG